jgi:hypothetical protein
MTYININFAVIVIKKTDVNQFHKYSKDFRLYKCLENTNNL